MLTKRQFSLALLSGLAALEYAIYFWRADHFFQGDTISWFYNRLGSIGEFLQSFAAPDPGGWYRPLTNRTIQSIFYPWFGFEPAGYRVVSFMLFILATLAVISLAFRLTRSRVATGIAGLYFAVHTVNAYTTYDLSFTPELVYSILYIRSALTFLSFLETDKSGYRLVSFGLFALSLCSKESAVTLPIMLFLLAVLSGHEWKRSLKALIPHALLLLGYLILTVGYLGVAAEALASLRVRPAQLETGGYYFMLGPHLFTNAALAWAWALNLPVGMLGQWRDATFSRTLFLWSFATLQMFVLAYALFRGERKSILVGFVWFWVAISPAIPLMGHFLPYYMFLPIVGFSILVGASWARLLDDISGWNPSAAWVLGSMTLALLVFVCARSSRSEARNNFLLGASSRVAQNSVRDLKALHPSLAPGTTVYINNEAQPDLYFHHAQGGLFRMAYGDESLQFKYSTLKQTPDGPGPVLRLVFREGHLYDAN